ncbi:GerW family sporulation protein [Chloroflexota bacterium]
MEEIENLVKASMNEIERLLSTKTVVGEPITYEGNTIVPLISLGFAFGAGSGSGKSERASKGEGGASGTAGGGGIKPTAIIVVNKDGVRIEPIKGATASVLEKMGDTVGKIVEKRIDKDKKEKE